MVCTGKDSMLEAILQAIPPATLLAAMYAIAMWANKQEQEQKAEDAKAKEKDHET